MSIDSPSTGVARTHCLALSPPSLLISTVEMPKPQTRIEMSTEIVTHPKPRVSIGRVNEYADDNTGPSTSVGAVCSIWT